MTSESATGTWAGNVGLDSSTEANIAATFGPSWGGPSQTIS
jgi:hypothetical protein